MKDSIYAAIDLHNNSSTFGQMSPNGTYYGDHNFATTEKNLISHVKSINAKKRYLVIEQCNLAHWAACLLHNYVDELIICDPTVNSTVHSGVIKNDRSDTRELCELYRLNALKPVYYATELGTRKLLLHQVKEYERLTRLIAMNKNQFQAGLRNWGYPIKMNPTLYTHPERVLSQIDRADVRKPFARKLSFITTLQQAKDAEKAAFKQLGSSFWEIAEFKKMPGCGEVSSHKISAYIQTPHRFTSRSQVVHFSKLAIIQFTSDGRPVKAETLARSGHSSLKSASYQIWRAALSRNDDNEVKRYYHQSIERSANETNARLNTQRKIIKSLWSLWKNNQPYRPDKFLARKVRDGVCTS